MRKYQTPETKILNLQAQSMICGSPAPAPGRSGSIGTMTTRAGQAWY